MAVCSLTLLLGEQESYSKLEAKSEAGTTGREGPSEDGRLGQVQWSRNNTVPGKQ